MNTTGELSRRDGRDEQEPDVRKRMPSSEPSAERCQRLMALFLICSRPRFASGFFVPRVIEQEGLAQSRLFLYRCSSFFLADVASRRGLRALAINQDTVRDARLLRRDLFKELAEGDDVRMRVMTPSMLLGSEMNVLLRNPEFVKLVRWMSIDEAQLIEQEGIFKRGYQSLLTMRVRLNNSTTWAAATATAIRTRNQYLSVSQREPFGVLVEEKMEIWLDNKLEDNMRDL
ncbi:hypothetical protein B0H10DRAFT_1953830 [Mycena sp. CBHHK59/15]|nr:hypothetical protein B0H10DRAFT_1953830 [Mycena sp. CBHHK59/15]